MSITTNKKNKIIADWKTGKFISYYAIAKHHKISQPKAKELLVDIDHSNADIVEAGVVYESAKKLSKNLVEINAIEKAVSDRVKVDNITSKILDGVDKMLNRGTKQIVAKVKEYSKENGSSESLDTINVELDASDLKNLSETVDKSSITLGVNQRHANSQINIQNTNAQQNNISTDINDFYDET